MAKSPRARTIRIDRTTSQSTPKGAIMKTEEILRREAEYRLVRETLGIYLVDLVIVPAAAPPLAGDARPAPCLDGKPRELESPGSPDSGGAMSGR
jgi:hypothetical protein